MTLIISKANFLILGAIAMTSPFFATAMEFATNTVHELESRYIDDCAAHKEPHGYYGAFLQPCEFTFRKSSVHGIALTAAEDEAAKRVAGHDSTALVDESFDSALPSRNAIMAVPESACADDFSTIVGQPTPLNWFFNMTDKFKDSSDSWDSFSSDDFDAIADKLMLWPDQCVGVTPRCYDVKDPIIQDRLAQFFDEIPRDATHVQVNCQSDAMELSRVVYAAADGFEKSMPTIIAWMVTVVALALVMSLWCCYATFRLFNVFFTPRQIRADVSDNLQARYISIENVDAKTLSEKERMLL